MHAHFSESAFEIGFEKVSKTVCRSRFGPASVAKVKVRSTANA